MLITIFITYLKYKIGSNEIYSGRASGKVEKITTKSVTRILRRRDSGHHKNKDGYGKAVLDKYSTKKEAIRGREQILIEHNEVQGVSGNEINGISKRNKKRKIYLAAAIETFGEILMLSLYFQI